MPQNAEAWYEQGKASRESGDIGGAITAFNQALKNRPDFAEACLDLARLLEAAKQIPTAIKMYEHWLRIVQSGGKKQYVYADAAIGKVVQALIRQATEHYERGEIEAAINVYNQALAKCPDMPTALLGMAACLHARQRYAEAVEKLLLAIRIYSGYAAALNTLGSCYRSQGQFALAIAAYRQAIAADPKLDHVWANLVRAYGRIEDFDEAMAAYEQSLAHVPHDAEPLVELTHLLAQRCQWDKFARCKESLEKALRAGGYCEPFKALAYTSAELQRDNAKRWAAKYWPRSVAYDLVRPLPSAMRGDGRLRIGYLSSDFHTHATLALISELFESHDRTRFEIYAYSCGPDDKSTDRERAKKAVDQFRDISTLGDQEAADSIIRDGIDILVELKGFTQDHRLGIAALRPAPIQMHYLGYPGTLGANFIDYFIADNVTVPTGAEKHFSECLIRLPHSYQINDRKRVLPEKTKSRAEHGLPEKGLVFCDFNASYKITPEIFSVWMRVLSKIESSVLWLYNTQKDSIANLKQEAQNRNIDPARLVFAPHAPPAKHLERYLHADFCLDTSPVCGHTTASDALWCGVPVVTLAGEAFASRVAASLLTAVGLPELVTNDVAAYEKRALELAQNPDRLAQLKMHLQTKRMEFPLFDSRATTCAIEAAYAHAVKNHQAGKPPQPFTLTPKLETL